MPLQRSTIASTAPTNSPLRISGTILQDYGLAATAEKAAKALKETLAVQIKQSASLLYNSAAVAAAGSGSPVPASIKLEDDTASVVEFQSKNAYGKITAATAEAVCTSLGVDVNTYFHEIPTVSFDTSVFTNADGSINETRLKLFQDALTTVAACLGIASPLVVADAVVPLPSFHTARYRNLSAPQQVILSEAIPNTTALSVKTLTEVAPAA